jgi:Protein of unknown function (DUF1588)/Protein of unknown function (DUF1592)/Protein of unknown function (DUF1595)/Protein of unknown function (DUF1585)/Protein of unknown function (DUF1587)
VILRAVPRVELVGVPFGSAGAREFPRKLSDIDCVARFAAGCRMVGCMPPSVAEIRRRPVLRAAAIAVWLAAGCGGGSGRHGDDPNADTGNSSDTGATTAGADSGDDSGGDPPAGTSSSTTRRLSLVELQNSYDAIVGVVPPSLAVAPPDSFGLTFDRMVNAQTISPAHIDAFAAAAREAIAVLITDKRLDDVVPVCTDGILPPLALAEQRVVLGSGLTGGPAWAIQPADDPDALLLQYATEATVSYAGGFAAPGTYAVGLHMDILDGDGLELILRFNGTVAATIDQFSASQSYPATVVVDAAGPAVFDYEINGSGNFTILLTELTIDGPEDPGAGFTTEREACAQAIVDTLAPVAFRRPISADERGRIAGLIPQADGNYAEAFAMVFEAIFANPAFLYLVEIGEPVADAPGSFALDPHEQAARLSYALCESPPDDALRAAVASGEFSTPAQVAAQVQRVFALPCGQATVGRFFSQWLWINRVAELDRDPTLFDGFDEDVAAGMVSESDRFVRELIYNEDASLQTLLSADHSWPDPRSASLYGLGGVSEQTRTTLPAERAGILTHPSVLAATSPFDSTSPVRRGVFVLEQVLCQELPPPPPELMVSPPAPDPNATTRERWAQHSSDPSCSGCHQQLDPIGFAFEEFDAIGRYRTTENGRPVDASGGVPTIGLEDGSLLGGAALARAVAESPEAVACFARQWLRFAMGRLEVEQDEESLATVEAALAAGSLEDALITLTTTATFVSRHEEVKP